MMLASGIVTWKLNLWLCLFFSYTILAAAFCFHPYDLSLYNSTVKAWGGTTNQFLASLAVGKSSVRSHWRESQAPGLRSSLLALKEVHRRWVVAAVHIFWGSCFGSWSHNGNNVWDGKSATTGSAMIFRATLWTSTTVLMAITHSFRPLKGVNFTETIWILDTFVLLRYVDIFSIYSSLYIHAT